MKKFISFFIGIVTALSLLVPLASCSVKSAENDKGGDGTGQTTLGEDVEVAEHTVLGAGGYGALFDAAIDPFDEHILAARCDMGSIYNSFDAGESWTRHNINGTILTLRFDPSAEGVIWAGGSGVYKSADHGKTFNLVYPAPNTITSQGNNLENGNYWIFSSSDYEAQYQVWSIGINRNSGGKNVYAAQRVNPYDVTKRKILIHSTDDGVNFKKFAELPYSYNFKLDYDESKDRLIVVTENKIYELDRGGNVVEELDIQVLIHQTGGNVMAFDSYYNAATNKNTFVFSVKKQGEHAATACYKTQDLTDRSSYIDLVPALVSAPLINVAAGVPDREKDYASYEYDEWINGNGYVKHEFDWTICNVSVLNEDIIYLYHEGMVTMHYADGKPYGMERRTLAYLKYDGTSYKWIYGMPHVPTTKEENLTWQDGDSGYCFGFSSSPQNPDAMVTSTITGIFYTPDGKRIYQRHSNLGDPVILKSKSETGTEIDIEVKPCTSTGLDVSVTYKTVTDPFDSNHLLTACTDFGLIQSFDGGKSWTRSLRQWNEDGTSNAYMAYYLRNTCYDLEFDRERKGVVYALWSGKHNMPISPVAHWYDDLGRGAFGISYDGGISWTMKHIVPDDKVIPYRMDIDYNGNERTIYLATECRGFFVSRDTGESFTEMNAGIPYSSAIAGKQSIFANDIVSCSEGIFAITAASASSTKPDPADSAKKVFDRALYKWNQASGKFEEIPLPKDIATVRDIVYSEKYHCLYVAAVGKMLNNYTAIEKTGCGVYKYADSEFTQIFDQTQTVWGVSLDSADRLYATLFNGAVYRFSNGNTTYKLLIDGLFHILKTVSFGPNDDIVYVATYGGGTEKLVLKNK